MLRPGSRQRSCLAARSRRGRDAPSTSTGARSASLKASASGKIARSCGGGWRHVGRRSGEHEGLGGVVVFGHMYRQCKARAPHPGRKGRIAAESGGCAQCMRVAGQAVACRCVLFRQRQPRPTPTCSRRRVTAPTSAASLATTAGSILSTWLLRSGSRAASWCSRRAASSSLTLSCRATALCNKGCSGLKGCRVAPKNHSLSASPHQGRKRC